MKHGFEQELQIVDAEKGVLLNKQKDLLALVDKEISSNLFAGITKEAYQSQIEYRIGICQDIDALEEGILEFRKILIDCASKLRLSLIACGVNPVAKADRAGENFGDHHHVGVSSAQEALFFHNLVRLFIPEFIALTANSSIHNNTITEYNSFRIARSPHVKLPPFLPSDRVKDIIQNSLGQPPKIFVQPRYWDVTPFVKSSLPTVEVRIFDSQFSINIIISIAFVLQALLLKLRTEKWDIDAWAPCYNNRWEADLTLNRDATIKKGYQASLNLKHRPLLKISNITSVPNATIYLLDWLKDEIETLSINSKYCFKAIHDNLIANNPNVNLDHIYKDKGKYLYLKFLIAQFH